jgi:hypothetical protein
VSNGERYSKTAFSLDWERQRIRCLAGVEMDYETGGVVRFEKRVCAACLLRERCTSSKKGGAGGA